MNRLWVRISLVITAVVIFVMLLPIVVGIAVREFHYVEGDRPPPLSELDIDGIDPAVWEQIQAERRPTPFPGRFVLKNLAPLLITATVLSIAVGVLLSRGLSAPLSNLAEAARAIGNRDLSKRVVLGGTQEVQEVARAFNEMAAGLEQAEILRQNLLADVAHELRTPLSVIRGNLQAILDDVYKLDKAEIARLYDQTRQLSRLVDDLRELAQADAGQLPLEITTVEVAILLGDMVGVYLSIMNAAGIELQISLQEGLPPIQADRARLTQCLQNLLNNAIHFTPPGGKVSISLSRSTSSLTIEISDTGAGIAPEHLPHVFDRFYRSDPARNRQTGGTGLGLAISRAIIEAHGGQIQAHSAGLGLGSTFIIHLPAA